MLYLTRILKVKPEFTACPGDYVTTVKVPHLNLHFVISCYFLVSSQCPVMLVAFFTWASAITPFHVAIHNDNWWCQVDLGYGSHYIRNKACITEWTQSKHLLAMCRSSQPHLAGIIICWNLLLYCWAMLCTLNTSHHHLETYIALYEYI